MKSLQFSFLSRQQRRAAAAAAVAVSLTQFVLLVALFASSTGELDPVLARIFGSSADRAVAHASQASAAQRAGI